MKFTKQLVIFLKPRNVLDMSICGFLSNNFFHKILFYISFKTKQKKADLFYYQV